MKRRLVITTEIISPYRIPVFNALAEHPDVDLHVIFLAETDPSMRRWKIYKDEIRFSYEVLPHWRRRVAGYNLLAEPRRSIGARAGATRRYRLRRLRIPGELAVAWVGPGGTSDLFFCGQKAISRISGEACLTSRC